MWMKRPLVNGRSSLEPGSIHPWLRACNPDRPRERPRPAPRPGDRRSARHTGSAPPRARAQPGERPGDHAARDRPPVRGRRRGGLCVPLRRSQVNNAAAARSAGGDHARVLRHLSDERFPIRHGPLQSLVGSERVGIGSAVTDRPPLRRRAVAATSKGAEGRISRRQARRFALVLVAVRGLWPRRVAALALAIAALAGSWSEARPRPVVVSGPAAKAPRPAAGALPAGVSFTDNGDGTATLAGTPAAGAAGVYRLTITAANGVSPAATQDFTLTVFQPPAITSADAATFTTGEAGSFTVTSSGFPAPALSAAGALPAGVTAQVAHPSPATYYSDADDASGKLDLKGLGFVYKNGKFTITIKTYENWGGHVLKGNSTFITARFSRQQASEPRRLLFIDYKNGELTAEIQDTSQGAPAPVIDNPTPKKPEKNIVKVTFDKETWGKLGKKIFWGVSTELKCDECHDSALDDGSYYRYDF